MRDWAEDEVATLRRRYEEAMRIYNDRMQGRGLNQERAVAYLTTELPEFAPVVEEHIAFNGEILFHLLMGDLGRLLGDLPADREAAYWGAASRLAAEGMRQWRTRFTFRSSSGSCGGRTESGLNGRRRFRVPPSERWPSTTAEVLA